VCSSDLVIRALPVADITNFAGVTKITFFAIHWH
jgi:hypothetical protein